MDVIVTTGEKVTHKNVQSMGERIEYGNKGRETTLGIKLEDGSVVSYNNPLKVKRIHTDAEMRKYLSQSNLYVVRAVDETNPWNVFLVSVDGSDTSASCSVYERRTSRDGDKVDDRPPFEDFETWSEVGGYKDWDGDTKFNVDMQGHCDPDQIALWLKAVAFFSDHMMALERSDDEYGMYDSYEEAAASLNCGDGADENPGIYYAEYKLTEKEINQ